MTSPQDIASLIDALRRAPEVITPPVRDAPPGILRRRPESGKWPMHEHACHSGTVQPSFVGRLETVLAELHPTIAPYDPGTDDDPDALPAMERDEVLHRFRDERGPFVRRLHSLQPADWLRTAEHAEYSRYSVFIMSRHLALHDFFHSYCIEELLLNPQWKQ